MFINSSLNSSSYAYNSYGANLKQQKEQTSKSNADGSKATSSTQERVTYGTVALRLMSDEEYSAFTRSTEHDTTTNKKKYAQSVDDLTNMFMETKDILHGKGMLQVLQDDEDSFNHLQSEYKKFNGMESVLDNALKTIKSIVGTTENQDIVNFINKFQATLSVDKLDLKV